MNSPSTLTIWTIYYNPTDAPGKFVTRPFLVDEKAAISPGAGFTEGTLAAARKHIPLGLTLIPRAPQDPPSIMESWI